MSALNRQYGGQSVREWLNHNVARTAVKASVSALFFVAVVLTSAAFFAGLAKLVQGWAGEDMSYMFLQQSWLYVLCSMILLVFWAMRALVHMAKMGIEFVEWLGDVREDRRSRREENLRSP